MKVIILAGGSGTRLWPLSRDRYPKQFIRLQSNKPSLFQETLNRSLVLVGMPVYLLLDVIKHYGVSLTWKQTEATMPLMIDAWTIRV